MKNITINIPSSSIDQNLYQYDGLYRENLLISKELDKDIQLSITFENDTPVNFKVKTTPFIVYESFIYNSEFLPLKQFTTINDTILYPLGNGKTFTLRKTNLGEIQISSNINFRTAYGSLEYSNFYPCSPKLDFKSDILTLGINELILDNNPWISISSIILTTNVFGIERNKLNLNTDSIIPILFFNSDSTLFLKNYFLYNYDTKKTESSSLDTPISYAAKNNEDLDGTFENIVVSPPTDSSIVKCLNKLIQIPFFLIEPNYFDRFKTVNYGMLGLAGLPVYDLYQSSDRFTEKVGLANLEPQVKKAIGYYYGVLMGLADTLIPLEIRFYNKNKNTLTDKSSSFYEIDSSSTTIGFVGPGISVTNKLERNKQKDTSIYESYTFFIPKYKALQFLSFDTGKSTKSVTLLPNITFKPKTATVNLKLEFNCADKSLNVDDLKNALSLIMEDGEWKTTLTEKEYTGNIADVIPD